MSYDPRSRASLDPFHGRGVAYSLLIIPLAVFVWLAFWQLGFMTSLVATGAAVGAVLLYRYGSHGTLSARGIVAVTVVVLVAMALSLGSAFVFDAYTVYPARSVQGSAFQVLPSLADDTGFWAYFGERWMVASTTWEAWIPTIGFALLFALVGLLPTLRVAYLGSRDRLTSSAPFVAGTVALAIVGVLSFVVGPVRLDLPETEAELAMADDSREVGDCLPEPAIEELTGSYGAIPLPVPCDEQHWGEVFFTGLLEGESDAPRPEEAWFDAEVTRQCDPPFLAYVGRAWAESALSVTSYYPSEASWVTGDRAIVCLAVAPEGLSTGSVAGSAR